MKRKRISKKGLALATVVGLTFGAARAATYDPTTNFVSGWSSMSNPDGACPDGYSSSFASSVTIYTGQKMGADLRTSYFGFRQLLIADCVPCGRI